MMNGFKIGPVSPCYFSVDRQKVPASAAEEFGHCCERQHANLAKVALHNLTRRVGIIDLASFAVALMVNPELPGKWPCFCGVKRWCESLTLGVDKCAEKFPRSPHA
jgi:hypothetical protein